MQRLWCRTCDHCYRVVDYLFESYLSRHTKDFCGPECLKAFAVNEENNVKEVVILMRGHEVRVMVDADTGKRIF